MLVGNAPKLRESRAKDVDKGTRKTRREKSEEERRLEEGVLQAEHGVEPRNEEKQVEEEIAGKEEGAADKWKVKDSVRVERKQESKHEEVSRGAEEKTEAERQEEEAEKLLSSLGGGPPPLCVGAQLGDGVNRTEGSLLRRRRQTARVRLRWCGGEELKYCWAGQAGRD
eukprot:747525-Hanusia_phi.AAC.3